MSRAIRFLFILAIGLMAGCREPDAPPNGTAAAPTPAPATTSGSPSTTPDSVPTSRMDAESVRGIRQVLMQALQPVSLTNCEFTRIGSAHDGGYVMCGNLLSEGRSAYSYGIGGHDGWGCHVSKMLRLPVHQYDCFEPPRLTCEGGQFVPHDECVGPKAETVDGRVFDTIANHIARNGDVGKTLIMKIDVEGAEWNSLLEAPDAILERVDQLAMEMHGTDELRFIETVQKLKRHFYPVHIHFNNWACRAETAPFPAPAYQVLFVNKRVAKPGPPAAGRLPGRQFDAPDNPAGPDCQLPTP